MTKLLVPVIMALTFTITSNTAQQIPGRTLLRRNVSARPAAEKDQPGPSLDQTMKWLQQRFPAPFEVDVKAGGHFNETVSYSTVLVDWKGCSAHFRYRPRVQSQWRDREAYGLPNRSFRGRRPKQNPIVSVAGTGTPMGCAGHQYFDFLWAAHYPRFFPGARPAQLLQQHHFQRSLWRVGASRDRRAATRGGGLRRPPRNLRNVFPGAKTLFVDLHLIQRYDHLKG